MILTSALYSVLFWIPPERGLKQVKSEQNAQQDTTSKITGYFINIFLLQSSNKRLVKFTINNNKNNTIKNIICYEPSHRSRNPHAILRPARSNMHFAQYPNLLKTWHTITLSDLQSIELKSRDLIRICLSKLPLKTKLLSKIAYTHYAYNFPTVLHSIISQTFSL